MRPSAVVAAIIFLIASAVQAIRYFSHWTLTIDGTNVPLSASIVGMIVPFIMAIWLLSDRGGSRRQRNRSIR